MLEKFLNENYIFKKNEVNSRIIYKKNKENSKFSILKEEDFNSILRKLKKNGIRASFQELRILLNSDYVHKFNPFSSYLEKLEPYDLKEDYIDELAKTIQSTDTEYFKWIFKKWLVSLVGCAINEREINHCVLILCGRQNLGKTTWFKRLVPQILSEYFYEGSINPNDKDSKILLSQKLLIMMDELANLNRNNNESYKELITKETVTLRAPYAVFSENYVRRASFAGTSNHTEILSDITGNRRYLCVEAIKINHAHEIDLDKVYAQALFLYKDKNFRHYFNDEDVNIVNKSNKYFTQDIEELNWIEDLFLIPQGNLPIIRMNATEVLEYIKNMKNISKQISSVKIGMVLSSLGFKKRGKIKKYELVLKN